MAKIIHISKKTESPLLAKLTELDNKRAERQIKNYILKSHLSLKPQEKVKTK